MLSLLHGLRPLMASKELSAHNFQPASPQKCEELCQKQLRTGRCSSSGTRSVTSILSPPRTFTSSGRNSQSEGLLRRRLSSSFSSATSCLASRQGLVPLRSSLTATATAGQPPPQTITIDVRLSLTYGVVSLFSSRCLGPSSDRPFPARALKVVCLTFERDALDDPFNRTEQP